MKQPGKASLILLPSMVFVLLLASLCQSSSVSAATPGQHLMGTRHNTHPELGGGNLQYHGGPLQTNTSQDYAIFWEPTGSYVSPMYNSLIERYFGDVGSSPLYANNTQYTDTQGKAPQNAIPGGAWVDTATYPGNPLSDAQVQQEVTHAQQVNHWSSSLNNVFFVFTAKGENICVSSGCSFTLFCAYHSFFGSNTIYGAMPYAGTNLSSCGVRSSPNNNVDADSEINLTSHEQMEAATDPLLNAWLDNQGFEIGDKCNFTFGQIDQGGGDANWNGNEYMVQEEWDNKLAACTENGWNGPYNFGMGPMASPPAVAAWGSEVDVYWKGTDGNLWEGFYNHGWHGPFKISSTPIGSAPSAVAHANGEQDVFWRGTDGNLWEMVYNGGWYGPYNLGMGPLGSSPATDIGPSGEVDVFWQGTDGNLWEGFYNHGWHGPFKISSTPIGSAPSAVAHANGEVDVYWKGTDGNLWEMFYNGGWHGPYNLGMGPLGSSPATDIGPSGEVDVFWQGTDGNLWEAFH